MHGWRGDAVVKPGDGNPLRARTPGGTALAAALVLLGLALPAAAREVQLQVFRFEIPDAWSTEGGGPTRSTFFATGARTSTPYAPPWLTAEACIAVQAGDCAGFQGETLAPELAAKGCVPAAVDPTAALPALGPGTQAAAPEVARWSCRTVTVAEGPVTLGVIALRAGRAHLLLVHASGRGAAADQAFLAALVRSVSVGAAGRLAAP
jgi:hypothetical protein